MQKQYLLSCFLLGFSSIVTAQRWDNYKPDNSKIKLTETNLPILYITTNNQTIDRENRIEADMVLIDNGLNQLNYSDTLQHPGQRFDYRGKIGLKYRGNSSFTMSDKKPYSIR
ncbi:MAG: spore coat protein CotH, partial [Bacteroidales bacterium]